MKQKILRMLREAEAYVSGQELCDRFGVSRTAVWKVINGLKDEGYEIISVPRRGYYLKSVPDILSESEIASCMRTKWLGRQVVYFEETDSTNTQAKRLAEEGAESGTLVVADMQTAGKGRRGRSWQQSSGTMISMTFILKPEFPPDEASMLTLVAAHSVAKAIEEETGLTASIKWPNDIIINGKKIVGILTEMSLSVEQDCIHYVVVGIGINVNLTEIPEEIRETATSLSLETGRSIGRSKLIARVMEYFEKDYEQFLETGDLSGILDSYNAHLISMDREVRILDPKGEYTGISRGMNRVGELLVEREDGSTVNVYAGEVSVRGLYGYV